MGKLNSKTTVLIVDDHPCLRLGLRDQINTQPGLEVIGEAKDGEEALRCFFQWRPQITLMDYLLPKMSGAEAAQRILEQEHDAKIILFSGYEIDPKTTRHLVKIGLQGFISKNAPIEVILKAIRSVKEGLPFIELQTLHKLITSETAPPKLSPKQKRVYHLLLNGLDDDQIAEQMHIKTSTVRYYIHRLFTLFQCKNRSQLIFLSQKKI